MKSATVDNRRQNLTEGKALHGILQRIGATVLRTKEPSNAMGQPPDVDLQVEASLRSGDPESQVDVSFECGVGATGLKRVDIPGFKHVRLESLTGSVSKTATGTVNVPHGVNFLCFNTVGTLLVRVSGQGGLIVIPPRSATFGRGGTGLIVQAARGDHSTQLVSWPSVLTPALESWLSFHSTGKPSTTPRQIGCKPIDPHLSDAFRRFEAAKSDSEAAEPLVLSVVYELVSRLMTGSDQVQLAALPNELPDTILELTKTVRQAPANPWPLKDAADAAGYSPFHFSRVFKSLVGYGFHEYVDRCRTEISVEMLCNTDSPVDLVASTCGFGTTQGLRESVKEYLGLVPSELRSVPETFESRI